MLYQTLGLIKGIFLKGYFLGTWVKRKYNNPSTTSLKIKLSNDINSIYPQAVVKPPWMLIRLLQDPPIGFLDRCFTLYIHPPG